MLLLTRPARLSRQHLSPQPPRLPTLTDAPRKSPGCYGRLRDTSRGLARAGAEQPGRCSFGAFASSLLAALHQQTGGGPLFLRASFVFLECSPSVLA